MIIRLFILVLITIITNSCFASTHIAPKTAVSLINNDNTVSYGALPVILPDAGLVTNGWVVDSDSFLNEGFYAYEIRAINAVFTNMSLQDSMSFHDPSENAFLMKTDGDLAILHASSGFIRKFIFSSDGDSTVFTIQDGSGTVNLEYDNDTDELCIDKLVNIEINDDVNLKVGFELYLEPVRNVTGSMIPNGSVVYLDGGFDSGFLTIQLAKADSPDTANRTIGVATQDIDNDSEGICTTDGTVHDVNTIGMTSGFRAFLSADTAGFFTDVKPVYPNNQISIGSIGEIDADNGTIVINITGDIIDIDHNAFNGSTQEQFNFDIASDGSTITGSLSAVADRDLVIIFGDGRTVLDTYPTPLTIELSAGTDKSPQTNYIYIPQSTKLLTKSLVGFPTSGQYVRIDYTYLRSASTTSIENPLINQNINNHLADNDGQGSINHIRAWIRSQQATYDSGINYTITPGVSVASDTITFANDAGIILQLHPQSFPSLDMAISDDIHIVNEPDTPLETRNNLYDANIVDADNDVIGTGRFFKLVIWGVANKTGSGSHLMCNLPTGSYTTIAAARADSARETVFSVPIEYRGKAFLIASLLYQVGGATWTLMDEPVDLRNVPINSPAVTGGGSAVLQNFPDGTFTIYNASDPTKIISFDLSGITTGNTRTGTVPDYDFTFGGIAYRTITGDTGSTTANSDIDTLAIEGTGNEIDTEATTDTLTIGFPDIISFYNKQVLLPVSSSPSTINLSEIELDSSITNHLPLYQYGLGGENMSIIAIKTSELPANEYDRIRYVAADFSFMLEPECDSKSFAIISPSDLPIHAGMSGQYVPVWQNNTGYRVAFTEIRGTTDLINYDFELYKTATAIDFTLTLIDLLECDSTGTDNFYDVETSFSSAFIDDGEWLVFKTIAGVDPSMISVLFQYFLTDNP